MYIVHINVKCTDKCTMYRLMNNVQINVQCRDWCEYTD